MSESIVNLCETCTQEYAECDGRPVFAIEEDPSLAGKEEADAVIKCNNYKKENDNEV
jgi:hypothetical protein